jgi:hypothetical protein
MRRDDDLDFDEVHVTNKCLLVDRGVYVSADGD